MAQLIVRNIEDDVKEQLAQRARRHGRSMEEEVRHILRIAVHADMKAPDTAFGTRLVNFFAEHGLDELDIEEMKGGEARPATFD